MTYYSFLTAASFTGTATGKFGPYTNINPILICLIGPIVGGFLFAYGGWRWTQWIVLILGFGVYLFGIAQPDTYPREIQRRRAKRNNQPLNLPRAQSGVTLKEMATVTLIEPLKMLFSEPIVIGKLHASKDC